MVFFHLSEQILEKSLGPVDSSLISLLGSVQYSISVLLVNGRKIVPGRYFLLFGRLIDFLPELLHKQLLSDSLLGGLNFEERMLMLD